MEKEGLEKIGKLKRQVQKLWEGSSKVERRDEGLFRETRIPRERDGEQRYVDWIMAVHQSMKRRERKEKREAERLASAMQRIRME